MRDHNRNWIAILALLFVAIAPMAHAEMEAAEDQASEAYERGTEALDDAEWSKAISHFEQVIRAGGSKADGALYWKAYAQSKLGRRTEAIETLAQLKKNYPKSRWNNDASALEVEIRGSSRSPSVNPGEIHDDDEKLAAINILMHMEPDRAADTIDKILKSNKSPKLKERALFILSQNPSAKAQRMMADFATGVTANPELQKKAIKYLGMSGGVNHAKLLTEIYSKVNDREVKETVLKAFMLSGNKSELLKVAKGEKDVELRSNAVRQLGVMGSRDELAELYATETSKEVKKDIIRAMFIGGSVEKLGELARGEKDPELRATAIKNLGLMGGGRSSEFLLSIYQTDSNVEVREAVIKALFLQGNAKALIQLHRKETNPELRRKIIKQLSIMGSSEAADYMLEILEQ